MIPKIISFASSRYLSDDFSFNSRLDAASYQDILWPCDCYTASIPYRGRNRLNIFEETILGLTSVETGNTEKLAEISCMNKDLVLFIQNRLSLMGYLDSRDEITDLGKRILEQKESDDERDFVTIRLFMDVINDKPLAYIHFVPLEGKEVVDDRKYVKFMISPSDDKSISAERIFSSKRSRCPTEYDVIRAMRDFRQRFDRYAENSGNASMYRPYIPRESAIFINKEPEQVLLHCRAFIQKSNPEVLVVTDGFGLGYSGSFADYLEKNWEGIKDLKVKAKIDFTGNDEEEDKKPFRYEHPIVFLINKLDKILEDKKIQKPNGKAEEKKKDEELAKAFGWLYEALERAFTQIASDYPVSEWKKIFKNQSYEDNDSILLEFVKRIGLEVNKFNQHFLKVKHGAIRRVSNDKPDMQASLVLAITGAANFANHPFNRLALEYPKIISIIKKFKERRDEILHGKTEWRDLQRDVEYYRDLVIKIVSLLLPKLAKQFKSNSQTQKNKNPALNDIERINQQRLSASLELDKFFGISAMNQMDEDLKELLINISISAIKERAADIQRGINNLASALQIVYYEGMLSANILNSGNQQQAGSIKAIAFGKAVGNKFVSNILDIPAVISGVDEEKLKRIIDRESYSLQSNFIIFLYYCENDKLKKIYDKCPKLLYLTAELADLRGHGNTNFSLLEDEEKAKKKFLDLKEEAYTAIKTILEEL